VRPSVKGGPSEREAEWRFAPKRGSSLVPFLLRTCSLTCDVKELASMLVAVWAKPRQCFLKAPFRTPPRFSRGRSRLYTL
jgi:hypothetical protein